MVQQGNSNMQQQQQVKKATTALNKKKEGDANKCKTCNKVFDSLQSCLAHEMIHLSVGDKSGAKKKRKRRFGDLPTDEDTPEQKEFKTLVRTALALCEEGTELNILCRLFQPVPENLNCVYERVHYDLQEELGHRGSWEIQPFGSTVTGMAFKCSDIDFYVENLNNGKGPIRKTLRQVAKTLQSSEKFSNVFSIHTARVPIIKCTHQMTGYNLDINVSSKLGVHNSRFIGKVLAFDKRIHPLMLIIKIWANSWALTRTGRMTNYCLTWLVFFYLQNCQPAILPPIKDFQKDVPKNLIDGINFAFNSKRRMRPVNNQNIKQIVEGFFKFYATFDFANYVISPYLGKRILRDEMQQDKFQFPEYYTQLESLKKQVPANSNDTPDFQSNPLNCSTLMVVQDPFVLNQNKSTTVGPRVFTRFKKQIANANHIFTDPKSAGQSSSALLIRLFYEQPTGPLQEIMSATVPGQPEPQIVRRSGEKANICKFSPVETELVYVRNYLRKHFPGQTFDKVEVNKFWTEKIVEFIGEILQDYFKIKMTSLRKSPNKSARIVGQSDVYNNKYTINCELEADVDFWTGRKNDIKKGYATFLQEQLELTKKYEVERIGATSHTAKLHCAFCLKPEADFSSVTITMDDLISAQVKTSFKLFFIEFTARMRNYFKAFFERLTRERQ